MLELPLIVLIVILFVQLSNLRKRVSDLELDSGRAPAGTPSVSTQQVQSVQTAFSNTTIVTSTGPTTLDKFFKWCTEDWLLKLGALLLLIGFGWFASYAFLHNWIGPVGRITLGIVAGAFILALGWWRINRYVQQGGIFLVLGSTTILLTIWAARGLYDFFTPGTALMVMLLSSLVVTVASVRYRTKSLAVLSLGLASVAPLLTSAPTNDYVNLFGYLLIVSVAAIWVVAITGWRDLVLESLVILTLYSLSHLFGLTKDQKILLLFAYGASALYFVSSMLGIYKTGTVNKSDAITAIGIGLFLLGWINAAAKDEWQSLIMATWAIVFVIGAYILYKRINRPEPLYLYAGVGLGLVAAATAVELSGPALTIAYTIETAMAILFSYIITKNWRTVAHTSYLLVGPILLSFTSISSPIWQRGVFHDHFFVLLMLSAVTFILGTIFWKKSGAEGRQSATAVPFLIIGSFYAFVLLWLSLHATLVNDDTAVMTSLLVYTLTGLVCYFSGKKRGSRKLRTYGAVILGAVVLRLLIVDVWKMELAGRIISFFAIGALLSVTAFIGRGKKTATIAMLLLTLIVPSLRTVDATSPTLSRDREEVTQEEVKSAFRFYAPIEIAELTVPSLVQISYHTPTIERAVVAVFDETKGSLIPSQSVFGYPNPLSFGTSGDGDLITDNSYNTCSTFWLPEGDVPGDTTLTFETEVPIRASGLILSLDAGTVLPKTVSISALVDGTHRTLVAHREIKSTTILFPNVLARDWQFEFSFNQPLRICEINLITENRPKDYYMARFLAQPGHSYRLYYDADRYPGYADLGDVPNFFPQDTRNNPVLSASLGMPQNNSAYVIADVDKDGVPDIYDNCGKVVNANQEDLDGDGIGDACEDFDHDGLLGGFDNCPNDPNRYQEDTDGDGQGDVCDNEESRFTEAHPWLPWVGIGVAGLVIVSMLWMSRKPPSNSTTSN